jgi:hypothetical protein
VSKWDIITATEEVKGEALLLLFVAIPLQE